MRCERFTWEYAWRQKKNLKEKKIHRNGKNSERSERQQDGERERDRKREMNRNSQTLNSPFQACISEISLIVLISIVFLAHSKPLHISRRYHFRKIALGFNGFPIGIQKVWRVFAARTNREWIRRRKKKYISQTVAIFRCDPTLSRGDNALNCSRHFLCVCVCCRVLLCFRRCRFFNTKNPI